MDSEYIPARKAQIHHYRAVKLYIKAEHNNFVLYKPPGITMGEMRVSEGRLPSVLYINQADKIEGIKEAQKYFNKQLETEIKSRDPIKIKEMLETIVEETLAEPRKGSLEGLSETVDILISDYSKKSDGIRNLIDMSYKNYSIALHSINVMFFALSFASYTKISQEETKVLALSALLHDVGKTKINQEILNAKKKLTDEEFKKIQTHTTLGYNILKGCKFGHGDIALSALEHHEKLDGSGYPNNKVKISKTAQIIGILDSYESLTNDDRPYRNTMGAFDTLSQIIIKDVKERKFDVELYAQFVRSLQGISSMN